LGRGRVTNQIQARRGAGKPRRTAKSAAQCDAEGCARNSTARVTINNQAARGVAFLSWSGSFEVPNADGSAGRLDTDM
jgi:hypothetical protein